MRSPRWFGRHRNEDLEEELQGHLRMATDDRVERGETPAEASASARREFGNIGLVGEVTRDMWGFGWLERLVRDVQYACRGLLHNRVYACAAIVTLALGIGATTAIFSILDSLLLRALPGRDPGRLVMLSGRGGNDATTYKGITWTYPIWDEIRRRPDLFETAGAYSTVQFDLAPSGETETVEGLWTSGQFFDLLGVKPLLGRTFRDEDDRRGGGLEGPVGVISYGFWQRRFGGAADVIGRRITIDRSSVAVHIVGVTPPQFFGPEVGRGFDVALPFGALDVLSSERPSRLDARQSWWLSIVGRLRTDQTMASATAALRAVQPQIRTATMPETYRPKDYASHIRQPFSLVPAAAGFSDLRSQYERPLAVLMAIVVLVLFVACANVANLQLARASARRHELGVRRALGASRLRLARQMLVESLVVAAAGAALGLVIARWGSALLLHQLSNSVSTTSLDLRLDGRLLGFATAVATATAILFGLVPALRAARVDAGDTLRHERGIAGAGRNFVGHGLVVAQVGLSLVLVIGAGLFVRSFTALARVDLGIDTDRVLAVEVRGARAMPPDERSAFLERVQQAAASVAGVQYASLASVAPVSGRRNTTPLRPPGTPMTDEARDVHLNDVGPEWFASLGIRMVAGRDFSASDGAGQRPVVIVNKTFAKWYFGDANAIGRAVPGPAFDGQRIVTRDATVVSVVQDSVYRDVREPAPPTVYHPFAQMLRPGLRPAAGYLFVRSAHGSPIAVARGVVSAIAKLDPTLALRVRRMRDQVDAAATQERLVAMLSAFFGLLALLLAAVGVFGVTAYAVNRRHAEIGLRMALGASQANVVRLVLGRVLVLVAVGLAAGGAASFWASRFVEALLFGIEPHDPMTFAGAALVLAVVGLLAAAVPAWRASRIDPTTVMRAL